MYEQQWFTANGDPDGANQLYGGTMEEGHVSASFRMANSLRIAFFHHCQLGQCLASLSI
jgi:hypothetical protein